jgi:hypothetical protein
MMLLMEFATAMMMLTVLEPRLYCQVSAHDIWYLNNSTVWQDTGGEREVFHLCLLSIDIFM